MCQKGEDLFPWSHPHHDMIEVAPAHLPLRQLRDFHGERVIVEAQFNHADLDETPIHNVYRVYCFLGLHEGIVDSVYKYVKRNV